MRAHWAGATYTIVLDLDLQGAADATGLLTCLGLGQAVQWSAMLVNGRNGRFAYDSLAWAGSGTVPGREAAQKCRLVAMRLATVRDGPRLIPVESAFGGYAVYRTEAVLGSSYMGAGEECEHMTLHYQMAGRKWVNVGWVGRFTGGAGMH